MRANEALKIIDKVHARESEKREEDEQNDIDH